MRIFFGIGNSYKIIKGTRKLNLVPSTILPEKRLIAM